MLCEVVRCDRDVGVYADHVVLNFLKIITTPISLGSLLSAKKRQSAPRASSRNFKWNMVGVWKNWISARKIGNISEIDCKTHIVSAYKQFNIWAFWVQSYTIVLIKRWAVYGCCFPPLEAVRPTVSNRS